MITSALLSLCLLSPVQAPPAKIELSRVWKKGQVLKYSVNSLLVAEQRQADLQTFIPRDYGFEYTFTLSAQSVDEDGNVQVVYDRPKTIAITGEYGDEPERRVAEQGGGFKLDVRLSPINELIGMKEIKPPAKPAPKGKPSNRQQFLRLLRSAPQDQITNVLAGQYIGELYRIALMVGSLDSTMDFAPKLDYKPVSVGSTWKKTVGYSPQKLSGAGAKQAVQRLDYVYTYEGVVDVNGKKVHRVTAKLSLDTDMWPFVLQQFGLKPADTPFRSLKLNFKSDLSFDLDLKTFHTLSGEAKSGGASALEMKSGSTPSEEQRFTGSTTLKLLSIKG